MAAGEAAARDYMAALAATPGRGFAVPASRPQRMPGPSAVPVGANFELEPAQVPQWSSDRPAEAAAIVPPVAYADTSAASYGQFAPAVPGAALVYADAGPTPRRRNLFARLFGRS